MLTFLQGAMLWMLVVAGILRWFQVASFARDEAEMEAGPEFRHARPHAQRLGRTAELFVADQS